MSLVNAPIAERRRWVFEVATNLYSLQKARFGYINNGQARERKVAWRLVKLSGGQAYLRALVRTISSFNMNDLANLNNYWKILLQAQEDQDFARLLTPDTYPDSKPSEIIFLDEDVVDQDQIDIVVKRYGKALSEGKVVSAVDVVNEIGRYAIGFGRFALFNKLRQIGPHAIDSRMVNSQTVPCTLSGLPLRHVKEIEVARSGKILKFRATGSVFLANQEGGEDAIRIEGLLVRSEIIFIFFLGLIFYYGQGKGKEAIFDPKDIGLLALRAKNFDITTFNKTTEKPAYTHHNTVPFVSRHIIIPNCYIETLSFEEKLEFGKDVIGYTILLRTYRKPAGFEVFDSEAMGFTFIAPKGNKNLSVFKMIEFFANMAWRIVSSRGWFIDEREWKIGGDNAESDDVYYNIDTFSLASTTILGVIGLL